MFFIQKNNNVIATLFLCCAFYANSSLLSNDPSPLSLKKAIYIAQHNDPWLSGNRHEQRSIELNSLAANTLPDPKISIDFINNPTDGFDFNQEGMTQTKVGVAQVFPRGKSLKIKSEQLKVQSQAFPFQRKDRQAKVAVTVGKLWLDLYRINNTISLIEKHETLFEQLIEISERSYASALINSRQQDIVGAQIELTRLEDRLDQLLQHKQYYEGMLLQWLASFPSSPNKPDEFGLTMNQLHNIVLSENLPRIPLLNETLVNDSQWLAADKIAHHFVNHPALRAIDKKVNATMLGVELAKQKYKPEWEVNASYGHRRDDLLGRSRADLFSLGMTFDVPLFTENKQDNEVRSAISHSESVKTEKHLIIREFLGIFSSAKGSLQRLKSRKSRYENRLLPQLREHAQTLLTAYANEDGAFSDVVKAHIAVLHAEIDELTVRVDEQKLNLELNYLLIDDNRPDPVFLPKTITSQLSHISTSGERL